MIIFKEPNNLSVTELAENYFRRIHFECSKETSLGNLKQILALHPAHIPFENLSPLLNQAVLLDIESVYTKLVLQNRGGYCFEHNLLLGYVLQHLGYDIRGIMARTLYNLPEGNNLFRGHMALLVEWDGHKYLADAGFGGLTLTGPLLLTTTEEQKTPHETFRVVPSEDEYIIEAHIQQEWQALYKVSLHKTVIHDYELASWYHCKHPDSRFTNRLVATLAKADKRIVLLNHQLTTYSYTNGNIDRRMIETSEELMAVLNENFNIHVNEKEELKKVFEELRNKSKSKESV